MRRAAFLLGIAAALAPVTGAAQAAGDHAAAEAAFLAALPPDDTPASPPASGEARVTTLLARNPGREADVRAAVRSGEECRSAAVRAQARAHLAAVARALPLATLVMLTRFYSGPDYARLSALSEIAEPSAAERAELQAISDRYALAEFTAETERQTERLWTEGGFFAAMTACDATEADALAARRLVDAP